MNAKRRAAVIQALTCCGKENTDCDNCPYLGGPCDIPFLKLIQIPAFLWEDIKAEMCESSIPWPWEDGITLEVISYESYNCRNHDQAKRQRANRGIALYPKRRRRKDVLD